MPNHVTTRCVVTGPEGEVERFERKMIKQEQKDQESPSFRFDFEQILPMPPILHQTEASSLAEEGALKILHAAGNEFARETMQARAWLEEHPDARAVGMIRLKAIAETGHPSWYEWAIENWGTKWNAYELVVEQARAGLLEITFQTAWSFPEPVFAAIAKEFSKLQIECVFFDEGWNFAGTAKLANGRCDVAATKELANAEMYERVYGQKPEVDEEGAE